MTTQDDIRKWIEREPHSKYMLVICDTFDYNDYPAFVEDDKECLETIENPGKMQKVMEVYNLSLDIETQLKESRAWHPPINK